MTGRESPATPESVAQPVPGPGARTPPAIVPQHAVLVLPSTAEFDSRTYRIASSLAARGHDVTVMARLAPGLPALETHPAGYRIVRVPVSAIDGLPMAEWVRSRLERAWARLRGSGRAPVAAAGGAGHAAASREPLDAAVGSRPPTTTGRVSRASGSLRRLLAIALTVRSQRRRTVAVAPPADLVHGMAYMGIPVALAVGQQRRAPVVYDARDIYLDAGNLARLPGPARRLFGRLERGWAQKADRVITVNRPYAEVMAGRFGIPEPLIVMNCAYRYEPPPTERRRRFHDILGLPAEARVVLYQGGFSLDRGIEQLVAAIGDVPGAVLVCMGYGALQPELDAIAADPARRDGELGPRVRILPAVPPAELLDWVASADVVAMPIQPTTLNHRLTTPNKLFEAMAAGVPVVASDLPGMAAIVRETGCGLLVDPASPDAIAAACRTILDAPPEERRAYGERGLAAAHERYSWETQVERLVEEYGRLTGRLW